MSLGKTAARDAPSVIGSSVPGARGSGETRGPESEPALFVATDLDHWEGSCDPDDPLAWVDVRRNGKTYRRLDPCYLAWIRIRVDRARAAAANNVIGPASLGRLTERWTMVQAWAREHYGDELLAQGERALGEVRYLAPEPTGHLYPAGQRWKHRRWVSDQSVAKVRVVEERARALGWTEAQLLQNRGRFPYPIGGDYGLVCYLGWNEEIGEITSDWIELRGPRGCRSRFYNISVRQPWIREKSSPAERPQNGITRRAGDSQ